MGNVLPINSQFSVALRAAGRSLRCIRAAGVRSVIEGQAGLDCPCRLDEAHGQHVRHVDAVGETGYEDRFCDDRQKANRKAGDNEDACENDLIHVRYQEATGFVSAVQGNGKEADWWRFPRENGARRFRHGHADQRHDWERLDDEVNAWDVDARLDEESGSRHDVVDA
jgi:hypothetical protein